MSIAEIAEWVDQETTQELQELKEKLHRQIDDLHDVGRLSKLEWLLDEENCDVIYFHTPKEDAIIDEAIRELDAGLGIPLAEVKREIQEMFRQSEVNRCRQEALRLALECPVATPEEIENQNEYRKRFRCRPT